MTRTRILIPLALLLLQGCGDILGPDTHSNLGKARLDWMANRSDNYTFEVTIANSWFPPKSWSVRVANNEVVEMTEIGTGTSSTSGLTIDDIWDQIIEAHEQNEINSVKFDDQGVPVLANMGPWEVDGGRSYEVQHFRRR